MWKEAQVPHRLRESMCQEHESRACAKSPRYRIVCVYPRICTRKMLDRRKMLDKREADATCFTAEREAYLSHAREREP